MKERWLLITFNPDDFRPLVANKEASGVIGASYNLTDAQIDTKLVAYVRKTSLKNLGSCLHRVQGDE